MTWDYWIALYARTFCTARGLRPLTIAAYEACLGQFRAYVRFRLEDRPPDALVARDVLQYLEYLRKERGNGDSSINRTVVVLRSFYRAMIAMGHLEPRANPMASFPTIKATVRKLPTVLTAEETSQLLVAPDNDTILGLRDRAILALLYGTGMRASECASLRQGSIDFGASTVTVIGKGGHQRTLPLHEHVVEVLRNYMRARGAALPSAPFLVSRSGREISRAVVYERVRRAARKARIDKAVSPHRLRHTFATDLVREGVGLVTIRDLLGHRQITSTQIYLHVTAQDLRMAADRHPIGRLLGAIEHLLPDVKLPVQYGRRRPSG